MKSFDSTRLVLSIRKKPLLAGLTNVREADYIVSQRPARQGLKRLLLDRATIDEQREREAPIGTELLPDAT